MRWLLSCCSEILRGYSMIWLSIWNLFHETRFLIFSRVRVNPSHQWNKFQLQRQKHLIFCLLCFLWVWNMFLTNLRYSVQYTTWSHNSLLFSLCEYIISIFSQCENNSLLRYHFYSMDKTWYFTAEYVKRCNTA